MNLGLTEAAEGCLESMPAAPGTDLYASIAPAWVTHSCSAMRDVVI